MPVSYRQQNFSEKSLFNYKNSKIKQKKNLLSQNYQNTQEKPETSTEAVEP